MPLLRGLTIIVVSAQEERFRAALTLACSQAALGGRVRVYCHERAVALLAPSTASGGEDLTRPGLPTSHELLELARESGVELIACQTGIALCGIAADALFEGSEAGGMVGILATLGEDRLVTV